MKRTKIICTMGPNADKPGMVKSWIEAGMDVARFNFSHGSHQEHKGRMDSLKKLRKEMKIPVAILLDTKGPEIRTGVLENGQKVTLKEGQKFVLTTRELIGNSSCVSVTYDRLPEDVKEGDRILVDDGLIELKVLGLTEAEITCEVVNGGELGERKGVNVPNVSVNLPAITDKDKEDLLFGIQQGVDYVAASFIRKAEDVKEIKEFLKEHGGEHIDVISKIENAEGVENIDEIIAASDGLMVARGDLGVEIPAYEVPILQKTMIKKTSMAGKPVITATQMLDSMIRNPRPTRAEVSDVANAVFDGTSCVMLSGETASGKYPLEAVQTMVDTIRAAELATDYWGRFRRFEFKPGRDINDAVTHASCQTAMDLEADAILTPTQTGHTARMISRFRPACPIVAFTTTERARRQLAISWGVRPLLAGYVDSTDRLFSMCVQSALKEGAVESGQMVVITAGIPIGLAGSTNLIKAQVV